MSDPARERRLDRIERRQRYALLLLAYPYLAAGAAVLTGDVAPAALLPAALPAVVLAPAGYLVALYRARTADGAGPDGDG